VGAALRGKDVVVAAATKAKVREEKKGKASFAETPEGEGTPVKAVERGAASRTKANERANPLDKAKVKEKAKRTQKREQSSRGVGKALGTRRVKRMDRARLWRERQRPPRGRRGRLLRLTPEKRVGEVASQTFAQTPTGMFMRFRSQWRHLQERVTCYSHATNSVTDDVVPALWIIDIKRFFPNTDQALLVEDCRLSLQAAGILATTVAMASLVTRWVVMNQYTVGPGSPEILERTRGVGMGHAANPSWRVPTWHAEGTR